jgi:hypothetical protein
MSNPSSDNKRKRSNDEDSNKVAEEASKLGRDQLLELAQLGIRQCPEVHGRAQQLLKKPKNCLLHCVRCHEDYDPNYAGNKDCKFDEHNESLIEIDHHQFKWECCGQIEGEEENPCFEGRHISDWGEGGAYWKDEDMKAGVTEHPDEDDDDDSTNWCSTCGERYYYNGM